MTCNPKRALYSSTFCLKLSSHFLAVGSQDLIWGRMREAAEIMMFWANRQDVSQPRWYSELVFWAFKCACFPLGGKIPIDFARFLAVVVLKPMSCSHLWAGIQHRSSWLESVAETLLWPLLKCLWLSSLLSNLFFLLRKHFISLQPCWQC